MLIHAKASQQQRQEANAAQDALTAQLASASAEITTLKGDIVNHNTVLESLNATFTATCIILATSATANHTLQRRLRDKNRQNLALTHQFETERTASANLRASLTNQHVQNVAHATALTTAHAAVIATVQTEKAEITEQLEHTTARLAHTEQDLTSTRIESAELRSQLESERTRANSLDAHTIALKAAHTAQSETLQTALATAKDELDRALARLESIQVVLAAKSAHILELQAAGCELIDEYKARCSGLRAAVYDAAKAAVKREQARYDERIAKLEALIKTFKAQLAKVQSKPSLTSSSDSLVALNVPELVSGASCANLLSINLPAAAELAALPSFASIGAIAATSSTSLSALAEQQRNNASVTRTTAPLHHTFIKARSRAPALSTPKSSTAPQKLTLKTQSTRGKENTLSSKKPPTSNRTATRRLSEYPTLA
ncbi:hypothetical protein PENSPDRAFT_218478 [Peniophora sp. CONT]|nr:hypothetical protein PENSPDRAFT_218478 [Peniophora sp. CONT]